MKTKRYDDGGYTGNDDIVKYRMGMIDDKGNDITKPAATEDMSMDREPNPTPAAVEKTVVKTKVAQAGSKPKTSQVSETKVAPKANPVKDLKEVVNPPSMPKSFKEAGGNTKPQASKERMPSMRINLPDPLANLSRFEGRDARDMPMKKGGKVSSASKRADGCATKGKTRGKMC